MTGLLRWKGGIVLVTLVVVALVGGLDGPRRVDAASGAKPSKGQRWIHAQQQRHLYDVLPTRLKDGTPQEHRNTGGVLRVFDQVWTDASSVRTTTFVSECIKPPKGKKKKGDSDARADGQGKSGKSGKGKGDDSRSYSASSSSSSTWSSSSSSNMIPVNNTDDPDSVSFVFTESSTTRGKGGKGKKGKKGDDDDDDDASSVRFCEEDEDENVVGEAGGKGKKGEWDDEWDDDQADVVGPPPNATPDDPPAASPMVSGEIDFVDGNDPVPTTSTPNASPTTFPDSRADFPTAGNNSMPFMGQEAVCAAFAAGTSPTNTPRQNHLVLIALNVATNSSTNGTSALSTRVESIYAQMDTVLQERIAPLLLNCVNQRRTRRLSHLPRHKRWMQQRSNGTEYVNVVFGTTERDGQKNCTTAATAGVECIPSKIASDLYYLGDEPTTFGEQLRQAILFWDFDIDGLLGFGDVQVELVTPEDIENPTQAPTPSPFAPPVPTAVTTRSAPPVVADTDASRDRRVNPGAFVAAAVAALTLILVGLFVAKRQRRSTDSLSKHREFVDNMEDDMDLGNDTDDNTAMTPISSSPMVHTPKAYVIGDDESWNTGRSGQGHEIYADLGLVDLLTQHGPHVQCSSPSCEVCELKRQSGTKFVVASSGMDSSPSREQLPPRTYEADDTVSL